jgi:hypothetical protein
VGGIIWLFLAQAVALAVLAAVVAGLRRRRSSIKTIPRRCSKCETPHFTAAGFHP